MTWKQKYQKVYKFFKVILFPNKERKYLTLLLWYLKTKCFCSFFGRLDDTYYQKDISKSIDLYTYCKKEHKTVNLIHLHPVNRMDFPWKKIISLQG